MPVVPFIPAIIGGAVALKGQSDAKKAGSRAEAASGREAVVLDRREREKFEEAMRQADLIREGGDAAKAESNKQAAIAEAGAAKLDKWARLAIQENRTGAKRIENAALEVYNQIQQGATRREAAGLDAASAIRESFADLTGATQRSAQGQIDTVKGIMKGFKPFRRSEAGARGQLDVEMGLAEGEVNRAYRDSPAYMESMRASRQAETDALGTMSTDEANQGGLYSGRRGEAMMDISRQGSWQRAGVENSYYNNYMNMLRGMSDPSATNISAGYAMDTAQNVGREGISTAGTGLNAEQVAQGMALDTMKTGAEGQDMMAYMRRGDEGANYIPYLDQGTAGIPFRMAGLDYGMNADANAGSMITGASPTGYAGANTRLMGVEAKNAAIADANAGLMGFGSDLMKYGMPGTKKPPGTTQDYDNMYGPNPNE
tara:strand:+ start:3421 stop:4707 length:1287 start_codon:yes stop_codon:yes gene_type:complete